MKYILLPLIAAISTSSLFTQEITPAEMLSRAFPDLSQQAQIEASLSHKSQVGEGMIYHFDQLNDGYRIEGATAVIATDRKGELLYTSHRFLTNKKQFSKNATFVTPDFIISKHAKREGLDESGGPQLRSEGRIYIARELRPYLHLEPVFIRTENAELLPAWIMTTEWNKSGLLNAYYYSQDGSLIRMEERNYSCRATFSDSSPTNCTHRIEPPIPSQGRGGGRVPSGYEGLVNSSQYTVFPLPLENPLQGQRTSVTDPADPAASPIGWHDIDGMAGAEYETTRGNNAWVLPDRDGNFVADFEVSGGAELHFDPSFDIDREASENLPAGVVNAFYTVNRCHDLLWHYGFDEGNGNFQRTNYSGDGSGSDEVEVYVQYGADNPYAYDPPAINNANFSTPPDGGNPVLRLYIWDAANRNLLDVLSPAEIAGRYQTGFAFFGPPVSAQPVSGELVLANDDVGISSDACQPLTNSGELSGNIALIDRGDCRFGDKILAAQQAGAIGAVVCNNRPGGTTNMQDAVNGQFVDIPSVFISLEDCQLIREKLPEGVTVELSQPDRPGPDSLDSAVDNGLIIHEYMHGLSNRLTGGPNRTSCLNNYTYGDVLEGEQMGEGWSDFYALAFTDSEDRTGEEARAYAGYLVGTEDPFGGIRPFPYSTDMTVNPVTYYDIYDASVPHAVGHVWASMVWDLYWVFRDLYGFSSDPAEQEAGNQRAIRLVTEAMKIQTCDPGFIDARDAILSADLMLFGGQHQCLIWEVFARRGLGSGASQGLNERRRDGKESYMLPPSCIATAKIEKTMTPLIEAGDEIELQLKVRNDTGDELPEVTIEDDIPAGAEVVMSSLPPGATVEMNKVVIPLGDMGIGEQQFIPYRLQSSSSIASAPVFEDNFDDGDATERWTTQSTQGQEEFILAQDSGFMASSAWGIRDVGSVNNQFLLSNDLFYLDGINPVLRFYHRYDTEAGTDGGMVEISTDGGNKWEDIGDYFFREGYPNRISLNTVNQADRRAFSGESSGWLRSYADLSPFIGEDLMLRFRFASDFQFGDQGWWIDGVEFFYAYHYQSEARLYSETELLATTESTLRGTIVEPDMDIPVEEPLPEQQVILFPNPGNESLNILNKGSATIEARIYNLQGIRVGSTEVKGRESQQLNTRNWPSGMYIFQLKGDSRLEILKWIKK